MSIYITTYEEKVAYFPLNHASRKNPRPSAPGNLQLLQVEPLPLTWSCVRENRHQIQIAMGSLTRHGDEEEIVTVNEFVGFGENS